MSANKDSKNPLLTATVEESYESGFRSGFIAVVGKPNVGKSTLVNQIVGTKVAIVSSKPQTTRHRVLGVKNAPGCQAVFVDTPGIHDPSHQLGSYMKKTYLSEIREADLIFFLIDTTHELRQEDLLAVKYLSNSKSPVILALNKIDLSNPELIEKLQEHIESLIKVTSIHKISALKGTGVDELVDEVIKSLPPGPPFFPPEQKSDQSPELLVSEIIREKVLMKTRQEIPHCVFVNTEEIRQGETEGILYIRTIVYVERESQKGIVIGKNGAMLKLIGKMAREEIELIMDQKVFLDLWVKVKEDWRDRKDLLRSWGYNV